MKFSDDTRKLSYASLSQLYLHRVYQGNSHRNHKGERGKDEIYSFNVDCIFIGCAHIEESDVGASGSDILCMVLVHLGDKVLSQGVSQIMQHNLNQPN